MRARLEQLVKTEQDEFFSLIETQSTRIDYYETLITALYTGPIKKKFNPIGTFSDFKIGYASHSIIEKVGDYEFQFRAGKHENYGLDHVNMDIIEPIKIKKFKPKHLTLHL